MDIDLGNDLNRKIKELQVSVKELRNSGAKFAEAEKEYKIELRTEALKLRAEKNMPVTMIPMVVYGIASVAEKRFKRDVAETIYQANLESINATKLMIKILQNQIDKEYGIAGRGDM